MTGNEGFKNGLLVMVQEIRTGPTKFPWFTHDGVLEPVAAPFEGRLQMFSAGWCLKTDDSKGASRYNDGDTKIVERFTLLEGSPTQLVGSMSVITDGAYGDQHVYVYEKCKTP